MTYLDVIDIKKSYHRPVLQDVSLHVNRNEIVSLLGTSGAGKTTLFHILSGILLPDHGHVFLDNQDITGKNGHIGYMMQKSLLFDQKTILDNVALPLILRGESKKEARERALPLLEEFDLALYSERYPQELSGGMCQRISFLRTYLFSSQFMLLDEPFSALDTITKSHIHEWFLQTTKKLQLTTLFITHDIDEAIMLSNRIYILADGRIQKEYLIDLPHPIHSWDERFLYYKRLIVQDIQETASL